MTAPPLELWVGAECTLNRVDERWRDQSELTGFARRAEDLDRLASLGAKRVRLPVLWERVAAAPGGRLDFGWADNAIASLAAAGVEPIVGLLHHGSGPRHTSLVDPHFPVLFADYARRVAERYPGLRCWTPINEPLTTARFSCLYGLWYPHAADDRSFVRALMNQAHAIVLAMAAIRAVNPQARLVQTDDLGFTRATPALADQAAFENERRWLTFDLLCGRVHERHPLWHWLRGCGAGERELMRLCEAPCVPDIVGINAYVTSERFLDDRLELHPPHLHGGNGRQAYADVETARAHGALIDGFGTRLREAHARYGLPLALTEVHMGCTREEQMRWLQQAWRAAEEARDDGVDVRAVTAWAAFGAVDWRSLLTREEGHYEPGLWDARGDPPRLTALGRLARALARGEDADARTAHPVLAGPGWWQRDLRLSVEPHGDVAALPACGAPLLILGRCALAHAFARAAHMRGLPYELRDALDGMDVEAVRGVLAAHGPWAVVDVGADDEFRAVASDVRRLHLACEGRALLAAVCDQRGTRLLSLSTDSSRRTEQGVLALAPAALVVRADGRVEPWELAQASLDLLIDGERGVWHGDATAPLQLDQGPMALAPPPLRAI